MTETDFGIAPSAAARLRSVFEGAPGLRRVWLFGSRARGTARPDSDVDLALEAPGWTFAEYAALMSRIEALQLFYKVDAVRIEDALPPALRTAIERDRKLWWEARLPAAPAAAAGSVQLKDFQLRALLQLDRYLDQLARHARQSAEALEGLRTMQGMEEACRVAADFPRQTWSALKEAGELPPAFAELPHSSRWDGAGHAIPNVCLKVPTGGGKTLLAAASVGKVFGAYLQRHAGLVLWIVPNEAIYRQTLRVLSDRDHPYRQMLLTAGAGRVKILEKDAPLTRLDVESHLCVMLLMLQSAARKDEAQRKLRAFRDRGDVLGFTPREDDEEAHWKLLSQVPNLDAYAPWGASAEEARATRGSVVKSSLGNVLRMVRPMVIIDEGHHAYSETALRTVDGFNPGFLLELSATPRVAERRSGAQASGSNVLVDVRGTDLDAAEMIKLPIHVDVREWQDWQSCLAASVGQLQRLSREAESLQAETGRYIRPILLVQVERTGKDQVDAGFIHAQHVREYLSQLGFTDRQIREKTSEKDEIAGEALLSPASEVRVIVTKQALQEGWDCPFAYVLCALAPSKARDAMTQLVGRILRLPQVAKTGRAALDACYVFCHAATTGEVVKSIKSSLEGEGMGDLPFIVRGPGGEEEGAENVKLRRRSKLEHLRIFLPKVTWAEPGCERRELVYDSDVLSRIDWSRVRPESLAQDWTPGANAAHEMRLVLGLEVLREEQAGTPEIIESTAPTLDRPRLVRALLDLAPNAWLAWEWTDAVLQRLLTTWDPAAIAASADSLTERLRADLERQRDALAQEVFDLLVRQGRIEFRLRADRTDYELPREWLQALGGKPRKLTRRDGYTDVANSLLEPVLANGLNDFEAVFAGYLDEQPALRWWHRNVAKTQYGLQGWKRHKLYPDFVFGFLTQGNRSRVVLLETKGSHLGGNEDTGYKQALLGRLTEAFCDERFRSAGELSLEEAGLTQLECDLVFDEAWEAQMDSRYFGRQGA